MLGLIIPVALNGLMTGAIYALVALGLTLIYGVLHIINFAHGSLLMLALYAVYFMHVLLGVDPYVAMPFLVLAFFALGYVLQRGIISTFSHGKESNILLVTLALSIIIDNLALYLWTSNTRSLNLPYAYEMIEVAGALLPLQRLIAFDAALVIALLLWLGMTRTRDGRAIRAIAVEKRGAELVGVNVKHVYALCFGIGTACLAAASCLLIPTFYVTPQVGYAFVLIAFTTVVLGGMGSFAGALVGGLLLGVVEALYGLFLGETLGQIGIFLVFILMLLFRPQGLFSARGVR